MGETYVLECKNVGIIFGGLAAVNGFNIKVKEREIAGLIGPNGAGKTTVFNLLTKVYEPTFGEIYLNGKSTKKETTVSLSKAGIARTFQNIRLFDNLSVAENVMVAMNQNMHTSLIESVLRLPGHWKEEKEVRAKALELLSIFGMEDMADVKASSLPYGAQRRLEIARALATNPSLLLLDEPAAGMNPAETAELMHNIAKIRDQFGIAILLIEHDMSLVMGVCDEITVLNFGQVIACGTPTEIQNNPQVIEAYLGRKKED